MTFYKTGVIDLQRKPKVLTESATGMFNPELCEASRDITIRKKVTRQVHPAFGGLVKKKSTNDDDKCDVRASEDLGVSEKIPCACGSFINNISCEREATVVYLGNQT